MRILPVRVTSYKPYEQLFNARDEVINLLVKELERLKNIKFGIHLKIDFIKLNDGNKVTANFISKYKISLNRFEVEDILKGMEKEIIDRIDKWMGIGSGYIVAQIRAHTIRFYKFKALRGSSYIPLPEELKSRKGLINLKNKKDNECFRWCHLAHLYPQDKNPQRIEKYRKYIKEVDYTGIKFPVSIRYSSYRKTKSY